MLAAEKKMVKNKSSRAMAAAMEADVTGGSLLSQRDSVPAWQAI
jgi:hypothetical protein